MPEEPTQVLENQQNEVANATTPQPGPEAYARAERDAQLALERANQQLLARRRAEEARQEALTVERVELRILEGYEEVECIDCQRRFQAKIVKLGGTSFGQRVCPRCQNAREQAERQERASRLLSDRREAWLDLCPDDYLDTDPERSMRELQQAGVRCFHRATAEAKPEEFTVASTVEMILNWPVDGSGLAMVGHSGRHKTRLMFKMAERLHMAGISVGYVNAAAMSDQIGALFSESARDGNAYLRRLELVHHLFVDDLGKARMTDRGEAALYRVLEERKARRRRTSFTANLTGQELLKMFSPDRGRPILRRLREMTYSISFAEK